MQPETEAGKALLDDEAPVRREGDVLIARGFEWERRDRLAERIAKIESDARAIGAQQERERLRAKRDLGHSFHAGEPPYLDEPCQHFRCHSMDMLLSDPQPDEPAPEGV